MSIVKARADLKKAFGLAAGFGFIIILSFLATDTQYKYGSYVLLIPMIGYIGYGTQISQKYRYLPDFADSVYYLGFLFTLMSLVGATIGEKLSAEPEKTITYFGMALMTTLIGLGYRTYHMQFTDINIDPVEKAKEELEKELEHFKSDLGGVINQTKEFLAIFSTQIPETLSKSLKNIEEKLTYSFLQIEEDLKETDGMYKKLNKKIGDTYAQAMNKAKDSVDDISSTFSGLSSNLRDNSLKIEKSLSRTLNVAKGGADDVSSIFSELASNLKKHSLKIEKSLSNTLKTTKTFESEIEGYNEIFVIDENLSDQMGEVRKNLTKANNDLNKFARGVSQSSKDFSKTLKLVSGTTQSLQEQVDQVNKLFSDANNLLKTRLK
jgi:ABC-type transporter Mla subunit MlaD